jgi:hypothetical protein
MDGNSLNLIMLSHLTPQGWIAFAGAGFLWPPISFRGKVDGLMISGVCELDWTHEFRNGQVFTKQFKGTISPDGQKIHVEWIGVGPTSSTGDVVNGWVDIPNRALDLQR